ncbi:BON domain-containing protein [Candidatus Dojkabacteria bacterium]|nr:BON domain-containing protein [Candidatus Dojkabacteria bacterium]
MATQEKIKKDVVDNLYWDTRIDASDIEVEIEKGQVTLKGTVPSYSARSAAASNALSIRDVTSVVNNLTVEYPSAVTVPSDSDIKDNVESSLLWDTDIDSTKIDVSVSGGIVTLEGEVDSFWKLYRAESDADLTGVIDIVNKLAVVPTESIVDKDIAEDVVNALSRNISVNVDDVNVKVKDGKVTLTGTVPTSTASTAAENSAYFTLGVTDVDNQLIVSY